MKDIIIEILEATKVLESRGLLLQTKLTLTIMIYTKY